MFAAFMVHLGKGREITKKDIINRNTLVEYDCLPIANPSFVPGP